MEERLELSALELDEAQRELLVAAIMANAAPELARRGAADFTPLQMLTGWSRPALAAAAVVAALCIGVLSLERVEQPQPGYGLADALAVPGPAAAWLADERTPTVADVLVSMESEAW
jgi:hypothetical protein